MALRQPAVVHHALPWWLELVGAAIIGAAILFGALPVAGQIDLSPTVEVRDPAAMWTAPDAHAFRQGEISLR